MDFKILIGCMLIAIFAGISAVFVQNNATVDFFSKRKIKMSDVFAVATGLAAGITGGKLGLNLLQILLSYSLGYISILYSMRWK